MDPIAKLSLILWTFSMVCICWGGRRYYKLADTDDDRRLSLWNSLISVAIVTVAFGVGAGILITGGQYS